MKGLINDKAAASPGDLNNELLAQTEQALEAKLTPENRADYMKVVVAGLHIALQGGPNGFLAKLHDSADPIEDVAKGAVALVLIMKKQAKGIMPMEAMVPAGMTLMLHGLDFIDRTGTKIAEPELDRATALFMDNMFFRLGITPKMLETATQKVHQIANDPDSMAKINLKAGITRHPDAALPAAIPGMPT